MKRCVFLIDESKKEKVEKYLNENGITFSFNDRFHFDFRSAVITILAEAFIIILIASLF